MTPHNRTASTVTTDRLFAPAPHGLIADSEISYAAFRLWCVLHRLAWLREAPEIERLCAEMRQGDRVPDRRSVYRWLGELESSGWLDWERTPGKAHSNRFTVRSERGPVTYESEDCKPVTLESQPVTLRSQVVTLVSQVPPVQPHPERMKNATQNHEEYRDHDGDGDRARARKNDQPPRHVAYLASAGMGAAAEFAHLDPEAAIADFDARRADGIPVGAITKQWRLSPPKPGAIYVRRSLQSEPAPRRNGRSGQSALATFDNDRDRAALADLERQTAERLARQRGE